MSMIKFFRGLDGEDNYAQIFKNDKVVATINLCICVESIPIDKLIRDGKVEELGELDIEIGDKIKGSISGTEYKILSITYSNLTLKLENPQTNRICLYFNDLINYTGVGKEIFKKSYNGGNCIKCGIFNEYQRGNYECYSCKVG